MQGVFERKGVWVLQRADASDTDTLQERKQ